jgi:hypothetical protein
MQSDKKDLPYQRHKRVKQVQPTIATCSSRIGLLSVLGFRRFWLPFGLHVVLLPCLLGSCSVTEQGLW